MLEEYPDADYIILEGGTNDADLLGRITEDHIPERLGAVDPDDYSGNYDRDTFCGALESVFYRATKYWCGKKICYIVAQKMGFNPPTSQNRRAYFEGAMQICRKWGIPYLDLNGDERCPVMGRSTNGAVLQSVRDYRTRTFAVDPPRNTHPNALAHEYESRFIEAWLRSI
jgi:lysophospholipase L1-like esterase